MKFIDFAEKVLAEEKIRQPKLAEANLNDIAWIFVSKEDAKLISDSNGVDFVFDNWFQTKVISKDKTGVCFFRLYENSNVAKSHAVFKISDNTVEMFFGRKKKKK